MERIFSIIMEWGLDLPTGTIAFWGTLVLRILTVDYTSICGIQVVKNNRMSVNC